VSSPLSSGAAVGEPTADGDASRRKPTVVLVVDTGFPGTTGQQVGIAVAIASRMPIDMRIVETQFRNKALGWIYRGLAWSAPTRPLARLMHASPTMRRLVFSAPPVDPGPDAIVVTGFSRYEVVAFLYRQAYGAFAIHAEPPYKVTRAVFDLVVRIDPMHRQRMLPRDVVLDHCPTPMGPIPPVPAGAEQVWCLLIGGPGSGFDYRREHWILLAEQLARLKRGRDVRLLATCSARSGPLPEELVLQAPGLVDRAIDHRDPTTGTIAEIIGASHVVFCTADSRSMLADGLAAGRPVYALTPPGAAPDPPNADLYEAQTAQRHLRVVPFAEVAGIDVDGDLAAFFEPISEPWYTHLAERFVAAWNEKGRHGTR